MTLMPLAHALYVLMMALLMTARALAVVLFEKDFGEVDIERAMVFSTFEFSRCGVQF